MRDSSDLRLHLRLGGDPIAGDVGQDQIHDQRPDRLGHLRHRRLDGDLVAQMARGFVLYADGVLNGGAPREVYADEMRDEAVQDGAMGEEVWEATAARVLVVNVQRVRIVEGRQEVIVNLRGDR